MEEIAHNKVGFRLHALGIGEGPNTSPIKEYGIGYDGNNNNDVRKQKCNILLDL